MFEAESMRSPINKTFPLLALVIGRQNLWHRKIDAIPPSSLFSSVA